MMQLLTKLKHRYEKYMDSTNEKVKEICSLIMFVFNITDTSKLQSLSQALESGISSQKILSFYPDLDESKLEEVLNGDIDLSSLKEEFIEKEDYFLSEMAHYMPYQTEYKSYDKSLAHLLGSLVLLNSVERGKCYV